LEVYLFARVVTIKQGAKLLGVAVRTLSRRFSGASSPTYYRASDIAVDLGMSVAELFPATK